VASGGSEIEINIDVKILNITVKYLEFYAVL
jgi:hypothetical protein